jgi:hypothetical protein
MQKHTLLVILVVMATLGLGAAQTPQGSAAPTKKPAQLEKPGVIFIVGGVGGIDLVGFVSRWTLPRAGVRHEIREYVWTHGKGHLFRDLQDTQHCIQKADELAQEVRKIKKADPNRPVFLMGKSGGAGLVLAAAEQLPPETLERIVLLSAAVSPGYDLRPALRATKHEIVSFYSPHDKLVLGWGTSQFGTIDRYYGESAGLRRFAVPVKLSPAERELYARLIQIPWHPAMILEGHPGSHIGTSMPAFVSKEVAPWLKQ